MFSAVSAQSPLLAMEEAYACSERASIVNSHIEAGGFAAHFLDDGCLNREVGATPVAGDAGVSKRAIRGWGKMIALSASTVPNGPRFLTGVHFR